MTPLVCPPALGPSMYNIIPFFFLGGTRDGGSPRGGREWIRFVVVVGVSWLVIWLSVVVRALLFGWFLVFVLVGWSCWCLLGGSSLFLLAVCCWLVVVGLFVIVCCWCQFGCCQIVRCLVLLVVVLVVGVCLVVVGLFVIVRVLVVVCSCSFPPL